MKTKLLLLLLFTNATFATPTTPTRDFTDNNNGTVTHKTTGLMWMRCAKGQNWTGSDCIGKAKRYTYAEATAIKNSFAGFSDWRLPNIVELQTIVERKNISPAINAIAFPNATNDWFWSSSFSASNSNDAWIVNFDTGHGNLINKNYDSAVRLVRGGKWAFGALPYTTPTSDFIDYQNGTVTHKRTCLMWQRCLVGQTWIDSRCSGAIKRYTYARATALTSSFAGFSDWRLPNQNELLSIVEYGAYSPAINNAMFPSSRNRQLWSSSSNAGNSGYAWIVDFYYGEGSDYNKHKDNGVRLVRGRQCNFSVVGRFRASKPPQDTPSKTIKPTHKK